MLSYVASIATAVTLMISPTATALERDSVPAKEPVKWAKPAQSQTVEIAKAIEVFGVPPLYLLSTVEQRIFRKALLRSVKIVGPDSR